MAGGAGWRALPRARARALRALRVGLRATRLGQHAKAAAARGGRPSSSRTAPCLGTRPASLTAARSACPYLCAEAVVSLLGCALALVLAAAEIRAYASPPPQTLMNVDTDARHPHEPLEVHLSVRFPAAPCELITVDALDISGERDQGKPGRARQIVGHQVAAWRVGNRSGVKRSLCKGVRRCACLQGRFARCLAYILTLSPSMRMDAPGIDERMLKTRLSANGTPLRTPDADFDAAAAAIVSSRGVPLDVPQAELVARRVEAAAARGEGCSMGGAFNVARVTGNFKATVHPSALGALRLAGHAVNLSHTIEQLSFGREFPGVINPLDGTSRALKSSDELVGATKYFVKVVPTTYLSSTSGTTESNQYSVTEFFSAATQSIGGSPAGVPAVMWIYDVSPIAVTIKEGRRSFGHLLSRLCAAAGGTFAITGLIARMGSSVGDMAK